jgi:hypothetical protein
MTFEFTEPVGGRRVGKTCVAETKRNKHRKRCIRMVTAGTLTFSAHAGTNEVRFAGLISKHRRLRPGSYTLLATATASGKHSTTRTLHFTIAGGGTLRGFSRSRIDTVGFGPKSGGRRRPQVPTSTRGEA